MRNIRNTKKGKSYDEIVFLLGYLQTRLVGQTTVIVVCFLLQKKLINTYYNTISDPNRVMEDISSGNFDFICDARPIPLTLFGLSEMIIISPSGE